MVPMAFWDAVKSEAESYHFAVDPAVQPKWDIPQAIGINVAVSGRFDEGGAAGHPTSLEDYIDAASSVIEAGACGVHIDFSWVTDKQGRRLDRDIPSVEAYGIVLEPLCRRFGNGFVANLNVLHGKTFDDCVSPARAGLAEVAPCASGHPEAFMLPAFKAVQEAGVKPEIVVHSTGEIELAKRRLIDPGLIHGRPYWIILYGLPFGAGSGLLSGVSVNDTQDMAQHLFMMVNQIRKIDPDSAISVCAAGRASLYMTTLATMMGLHIRVGAEDTPWRFPNSDEKLKSNLQMFTMAKEIAALHGRRTATADEFRAFIGHTPRLATPPTARESVLA